MSHYVGWSEAAFTKVHGEAVEGDLQWTHGGLVAPKQILRSFTPINNGPVKMSASSNAPRVPSRGLDSDSLYDIPDAPLASLPAPRKEKRTLRTHPRPKKASSHILSHPWPKTVKGEASQLNHPADLSKKPSRRSSAQMKLFSSAGITKPIVSPMKWVTTEDVLRSKGVALGQTTIENLVSYRSQAAAHFIPETEAFRFADAMEGIIEEPAKASEPCHDIIRQEEVVDNISNDHASRNHNEEQQYHILDGCNLTGFYKKNYYEELSGHDSASHNGQDPYDIPDRVTVPYYDKNMFMAGDEELSMNQCGATLTMKFGTEDEFPVDDELETEMAKLLMPDQILDSHSAKLLIPSLEKQDSQTGSSSCIDLRSSRGIAESIVRDNSAPAGVRGESASSVESVLHLDTVPRSLSEAIDWPSKRQEGNGQVSIREEYRPAKKSPPEKPAQTTAQAEDDDYSPLKPFARPAFPSKVQDRSPITGVSSSIVLRTCFRIGEALREGARCDGQRQDAIIELFARVKESSSDTINPSKLYFEFADLFHDRPPYIQAMLENSKISDLQDTESRMLLGAKGPAPMTRCLGRLKRVIAASPGWMLHIINIRPTDWEEVRWTRQIAGAGMAK